jgi:phosphopantothenoylcysteine decarboxylase/phosphopantothenate--cysteine ligase
MAGGIADSLATTLLLATDAPVLAAPAMNVRMWLHPATRRNVAALRADGVTVMEPDEGVMACNEYGPGRLPEPPVILERIRAMLASGVAKAPARLPPPEGGPAWIGRDARLAGRHIVITAGPTHEPIDPVRYIANRSSGKQGFAIAGALAARGARITLVSGPVSLPTPPGVTRVDVETARQMASEVGRALPADAAIMVAAVADWRVEPAEQKIKKRVDGAPPALGLSENPDILAELARDPRRPALVVGFAAETENVVDNAVAKRARKGADWIVANDVSGDVMGGAENRVHLVTADGVEDWPQGTKQVIAERLAERIAEALGAAR